jgi:hypothetical protein
MHKSQANTIALLFSLSISYAQNQSVKLYDIKTGFEIREFTKNEVVFKFLLNRELDTVKVWTTDPKFSTSEDYKIGTKYSELPAILRNQMFNLPGEGYFVRLYSGWKLAFCEGIACRDMLTEDSEVKWIEKRL